MAQLRTLFDRLPLPFMPPNLKIGREIDKGAWGVVYEGELGGQPVAVKMVHELLVDAEDGDSALQSFFEECERLKTVDHPHVIKFSGAFKDAQLGPILVMEKMKENLRRFLERRKDKLSIQEQIRISQEITNGITFLHQMHPPMVHRDLNDKNVMFTFKGVAKIGDFGQSKLKKDLYLTSDQPGMVSFMPPEALGETGTSKYDESLDMFSLGVLLLEIGTQQQPMCSMLGIGVTPEIKRRDKDLQKMGDLHPLKPFILLCLNDDRKQRPKAAEMHIVLSTLKVNMLQTILVAEQSAHRKEDLISDMQVQLRDKAAENQGIQLELDHAKADVAGHVDTIRRLQDWCKQLGARMSASEEHARLREAETRMLQRELDKKQEQEEAIKADFQIQLDQAIADLHTVEVNLRAANEEKQSIQRQLDRVNMSRRNEERANLRLREAETQRLQRELAAKQEQEAIIMADLQKAGVNLRAATEEKMNIQKELDRANELLASEKMAENVFIAKMEKQIKSYKNRSNPVQHERAGKEMAEERQINLGQKQLTVGEHNEPRPAAAAMLTPRALAVATPNAVAITMPKVPTVAGIEEPAATTPEAHAVAMPEPRSVTTPVEPAVAPPKIAAVAPPKTAAVDPPKTAAVATPKTAAVATPKTAAVATPETAAVATPKTAAVATPKTAAVATPKTAAVATPKTAAVATPKTAAVAMPITRAVAVPKVPIATVAKPEEPAGAMSEAPTLMMLREPTVAITEAIAVATPRETAVPRAHPVAVHEVPTVDSSVAQQKPIKAFTDKKTGDQNLHRENQQHAEVLASRKPIRHHKLQLVDGGSEAPETQDRNMKDAPSCEKCGKVFPWNKLHLRWKHMSECTASAEPPKPAANPVPAGVRHRAPTETDIDESRVDVTKQDVSEDLPSCEKCGRKFPWNQLHLRWKHKCEASEEAQIPIFPLRRTQSSASSVGRPMPRTARDDLTRSTIEEGVQNEGRLQAATLPRRYH